MTLACRRRTLLATILLLSSGCQAAGWRSCPGPADCSPANVCYSQGSARTASAASLLAQAEEFNRLGRDDCVDLYYRAALQAAQGLQVSAPGQSADTSACDTYHRSLAGLIVAGQQYGRLDPRKQLVIRENGVRVVPTRYYGFAWQPTDFNRLVSASEFETKELSRRHATSGFGLPLVGVRIAPCRDELFYREWQPFAVTAVLRPAVDEAGGAVLELYNPHAIHAAPWAGGNVALARDLTAPLAAIVEDAPRQYLRGFTAPSDTEVKPKLIMVEPYQRGKIPVIFIHGLYSDAITWADTANELRSHADLYARFQFWTFRYPTGGDVLESAAELREKLQLVRHLYAPADSDPALDQMVLIGHSLGGLVSKTQVVASENILWSSIANQPFDVLQAPPQLRMRLSRSLFFEPLPFVTRVVFVGTPHRGSSLTRRLAGRLGSSLVRFGTEDDTAYRQLMEDNREVFKPLVTHRRPTSIDMLEPTSPFLAALERMPMNRCVRTHSIIGTGGSKLIGAPGDGVVSVTSATQCGVQSELYVDAKHEKLHRDPDSVAEMARILRLHASECGQVSARRPASTATIVRQ